MANAKVVPFKIEKGIAPPKRNKYDFSGIEVGDSIFLEGEDRDSKFFAAIKKHFQRSGGKITSAKQDGGLRIWRIK